MKLLDKARSYIAYQIMPATCQCGHPQAEHSPSLVFKQGTCNWNECKCGKIAATNTGQSPALDVAATLGKHAGMDVDGWLKSLDWFKNWKR
jgi:hypothetical protein